MIARGAQGPIQRAFTGLLGLFDLKGSEVSPNSMAGFVQPILDVRQYILAGTMLSREGTGTTAFGTAQYIGCAVPVRVPENKVWIIQAATSFVNLAAADTCIDTWIAIRRSGTVVSQAYRLGNVTTAKPAAGAPAQLTASGFVGPLVLPSGWEFGVGFSGLVSAGVTFNVGVIASEFQA